MSHLQSNIPLQAIPHLVAWQGANDSSVWSLLAQLWRTEEKEMGVPRELMNTLAGLLTLHFL